MILFLDIDGVLQPSGHHCLVMDRLPILEDCLRQPSMVHVKIVITSTWRMSYSLDKLRSYFAPDMQDRVVGVTPIDPEVLILKYLMVPSYLDDGNHRHEKAFA